MSPRLRRALSLALVALGIAALELRIARSATDAPPSPIGNRESIWVLRTRQIRSLAEPARVVFLGDSTVERGIDEELFRRASGLRALNLGLTGDLVTFGDYRILSEYLRRHAAPAAVVVWHTLDVWPRPLDLELAAFTSSDPGENLEAVWNGTGSAREPAQWLRLPVRAGEQVIRAVLLTIPSYRYREWLQPAAFSPVLPMRRLRQPGGSKLERQLQELVRLDFQVSRDSEYWFGKLARLCRERGIALFGARSPIHEQLAGEPRVRALLAASNARLDALFERHGVQPLNALNPAFSAAEGVDDKDHVGPAGRERLTLAYAALVSQRLALGSR